MQSVVYQPWGCLRFVHIYKPPTAGGGMFVNFLVLNHVCQLCQGMAKYAISFDNLYQKYITRGYVCEFWGPHKVDKHTFLEKLVFQLFLHISFGLPGPLRTAFELKNSTAYSKKSGACDCANGKCY